MIHYHLIQTKAQQYRGQFEDLKMEMTGHESLGKECMAVGCYLASLMRLSMHNSEHVCWLAQWSYLRDALAQKRLSLAAITAGLL